MAPVQPRVPASIGKLGGWFALIVCTFVAAGLAWTPLRPAYRGTLMEDLSIDMDPGQGNVDFQSWLTFMVITTLLCAVATALVVRSTPPRLSVLFWLLVTLIVATLSFASASDLLSAVLARGYEPGDHITYRPPLSVGIGALLGPWLASVLYFIALFVRAEDDPSEELVA